ncbi:hypothetical protein EJ02DRAFT_385415 [Clathrospora elynae]|uniref:Hap4 transcription factor heteromerisation domain-containing protein n=1 Tax=Clathrospora elynae TaxID=706981 RepID=A0A6A5SDJ8_9PLEO|nr:hypothetical protein EJ02DRAFT_385415 [Clathrospora elynae]
MALEEQRKADKSELLAEIARLHEQLRTANDDVRMATQQATYYQHEYEKLRDDNTPAAVPQRLQSSFNGHRSVRTMDPYFDARAETVPDAAFRAASSQCDDCQPSNCRCVDEMTNAAAYAVGQPAPVDAVPLPPRRVPSPMAGVVRGHDAGAAEDVDFSAREFDFTPPTAFMSSTDTPTACGLCIDNPDLCFCKHESLEPGDDDTKPSMAMTGPGSCADCQSNPQQKAWCQRVAQLRAEATPPNSRRTSLEIMKPKAATGIDLSRAGASPVAGDATVGCSDAFKLLQGRVSTDPNGIMDWRHLKPVSHIFAQQGFTMEPGRYSAMELDASSILTTLQHATCPLQPRSSDGAHARLVQEAEERRRASFSPVAHTEDHMMGRALSRFNLGG